MTEGADVSTEAGRGNAQVAVALAAIGAAVAFPILGGDLALYLDNPVHIVEVLQLARGAGWADLGPLGVPIDTLHSPVWYGGLAAAVAAGGPVKALYSTCVFVSFLAPAIAIALLSLKSGTGRALALGLGAAWLLHPAYVVGYSSPLGGMWTCALATAMLIPYMRALVRRDLAAIAFWLGAIGLTHLFVLMGAAVVGLCAALSLAWRRDWASVRRLAGGALLGAVVSAPYWYPNAVDGGSLPGSQVLWVPAAIERLFVPTDIVALLARRVDFVTLGGDLLPGAVLALAAVIGIRRRRESAVTRLALLSAGVLFMLVTFFAQVVPTFGLGPLTWRYLDLVRFLVLVGAASIPLSLPKDGRSRLRAGVLGLSLAWAAAAAFGTLEATDPDARRIAYQEARALLDDHPPPPGQRILLQDTFDGRATEPTGGARTPAGAQASHFLVLAAHEAGYEQQVGAYYGVGPFPAAFWTHSEFGLFLGVDEDDREARTDFRERVARLDTPVALAASDLGESLLEAADFTEADSTGDYHLYTRANREARSAVVIDGALPGVVVPRLDGELSIAFNSRFSPTGSRSENGLLPDPGHSRVRRTPAPGLTLSSILLAGLAVLGTRLGRARVRSFASRLRLLAFAERHPRGNG